MGIAMPRKRHQSKRAKLAELAKRARDEAEGAEADGAEGEDAEGVGTENAAEQLPQEEGKRKRRKRRKRRKPTTEDVDNDTDDSNAGAEGEGAEGEDHLSAPAEPMPQKLQEVLDLIVAFTFNERQKVQLREGELREEIMLAMHNVLDELCVFDKKHNTTHSEQFARALDSDRDLDAAILFTTELLKEVDSGMFLQTSEATKSLHKLVADKETSIRVGVVNWLIGQVHAVWDGRFNPEVLPIVLDLFEGVLGELIRANAESLNTTSAAMYLLNVTQLLACKWPECAELGALSARVPHPHTYVGTDFVTHTVDGKASFAAFDTKTSEGGGRIMQCPQGSQPDCERRMAVYQSFCPDKVSKWFLKEDSFATSILETNMLQLKCGNVAVEAMLGHRVEKTITLVPMSVAYQYTANLFAKLASALKANAKDKVNDTLRILENAGLMKWDASNASSHASNASATAVPRILKKAAKSCCGAEHNFCLLAEHMWENFNTLSELFSCTSNDDVERFCNTMLLFCPKCGNRLKDDASRIALNAIWKLEGKVIRLSEIVRLTLGPLLHNSQTGHLNTANSPSAVAVGGSVVRNGKPVVETEPPEGYIGTTTAAYKTFVDYLGLLCMFPIRKENESDAVYCARLKNYIQAKVDSRAFREAYLHLAASVLYELAKELCPNAEPQHEPSRKFTDQAANLEAMLRSTKAFVKELEEGLPSFDLSAVGVSQPAWRHLTPVIQNTLKQSLTKAVLDAYAHVHAQDAAGRAKFVAALETLMKALDVAAALPI